MKKAIALLIAAAAFLPAGAFAATIANVSVEPLGDFVVEPAKIEIFVNPGETVERTISVTSRVAGDVPFKIVLEDFVGAEDGSTAVRLLGEDTSPYSFKKSISIGDPTFTLGFAQRITIPITITVPEDAAPGGYYTSVVVSNDKGGLSSDQSGTEVISRVAQLIFVRVNGDVNEGGAMKDFRLTPDGFFRSKGPFTYEVLFENTGNVHLAPYGLITVRNLFGKVVGQIPIDAYYAMPRSQRYRQVTWDKQNLFGYYSATLELNTGVKKRVEVQEMSLSFIIVPWKMVGIVGGLLALLLAAYTYFRKNFKFVRASDAKRK